MISWTGSGRPSLHRGIYNPKCINEYGPIFEEPEVLIPWELERGSIEEMVDGAESARERLDLVVCEVVLGP